LLLFRLRLRGLICKLLANRTYLGELKHRTDWVKGDYPAILSERVFDQARAIPATNSQVRANHTRSKTHFLLKGLVFGSDGRAMSPWHSVKKNVRKYRYYIPQRDTKEGAGTSWLSAYSSRPTRSRRHDSTAAHPARAQSSNRNHHTRKTHDSDIDEAKVTVALTQFAHVWEQLFPAEQSRIVNLLFERITVSTTELDIRANGLEQLVTELT
jgi:site-specific DNA recombinase